MRRLLDRCVCVFPIKSDKTFGRRTGAL
jgi:hypothetical protein